MPLQSRVRQIIKACTHRRTRAFTFADIVNSNVPRIPWPGEHMDIPASSVVLLQDENFFPGYLRQQPTCCEATNTRSDNNCIPSVIFKLMIWTHQGTSNVDDVIIRYGPYRLIPYEYDKTHPPSFTTCVEPLSRNHSVHVAPWLKTA